MVLLTNPLKRFALAGALLFGCLPGVAQAKWIKATVSGTTVLTNAQQPPNVGTSIGELTFVFQNYAGATPSGGTNEWGQLTARPNYTQLFGYGTGGTTGLLQGNYDASSTPYNSAGMGNFFTSNTNGTNFSLRVGSQGSSSGLTVATGDPSVTRNVEYISLENGTVNLVNTAPTSNDVVDFLKASLGTRTCTISESTCVGKIQTADEALITFSWSTIQFEEIEAVPAPLPIAGALAGFRLSRKIRSRIKAN